LVGRKHERRGIVRIRFEDTEYTRFIGNLTSAEYVTMYHGNVVGEAIAAGDIDSAISQIDQNPV
jgi:hypothetical protein